MPRSLSCIPWIFTTALIAGSSGCGSPRPTGLGIRQSPGDFSSRRILDADLAAVRPVAVQIFRQHYRLDQEASTETILVARPTEFSGRGASPQLRDRVSLTPAPQRQVAELRLRQEGPHVLVQVTVQNQRTDTVERASFSRVRGDDRPGDTPIDRPGFASAAPREEWVATGRDRKLEQQILEAIQQQLATTQPAP